MLAPDGESLVSFKIFLFDAFDSFLVFIERRRFDFDFFDEGAVDGDDVTGLIADTDQIANFSNYRPFDGFAVGEMENIGTDEGRWYQQDHNDSHEGENLTIPPEASRYQC